MVMHVQVCQETSFVSMDDSINVILLERDDRDESLEVEVEDKNTSLWTLTASRDTSTVGRENVSMDNSRQTVNTRTSILDLTRDEDEEEDDDEADTGSVLFQDLQETIPSRLQEDDMDCDESFSKEQEKTAAMKQVRGWEKKPTKKATSEGLFGRFSPDHFFDHLCSANTTTTAFTESTCSRSSRNSRTSGSSSSISCMNIPCTSPSNKGGEGVQEDASETSPSHQCPTKVSHQQTPHMIPVTPSDERLQLEMDLWNLLGCSSPPDILELESIWHLTTTADGSWQTGRFSSKQNSRDRHQKRSVRACLKDRMQRIHRLRQDRWAGATRHGVTLSQHGPYSPSISLRAVSMDHLDSKDYSRWNEPSVDMSTASLYTVMGLTSTKNKDLTLVSSNPRRRQDGYQYSYNSVSNDGLTDHLQAADGYDSDPELSSSHASLQRRRREPSSSNPDEQEATSVRSKESTNHHHNEHPSHDSYVRRVLADHASLPLPKIEAPMDQLTSESDDHDYIIYQTVQQTLNSTWTMTWHPNQDNIKEFHIPSKPLMINIWMERGTVITHNGVVIEPLFMWRDAYQSHYLLQQRKRLNPTCQKPWSMRLLNTCRIAPCTYALDKTKYPLARQAHCLIVKTCQGQEFVLEANSASQMELICERWKITVARFASLAVTEDIDAIAQEFFHPTLSSQTLTVQQQQQQQQQQEQQQDASMVSSSEEGNEAEEDEYESWSSSPSDSSSGKRSTIPARFSRDPAVNTTAAPIPIRSGTNKDGRRWTDI